MWCTDHYTQLYTTAYFQILFWCSRYMSIYTFVSISAAQQAIMATALTPLLLTIRIDRPRSQAIVPLDRYWSSWLPTYCWPNKEFANEEKWKITIGQGRRCSEAVEVPPHKKRWNQRFFQSNAHAQLNGPQNVKNRTHQEVHVICLPDQICFHTNFQILEAPAMNTAPWAFFVLFPFHICELLIIAYSEY